MTHKKIEHRNLPMDATPVERVQRWVHGAYDRVIDPAAVGTTATIIRGVRTAGLSIREAFRSIWRS
ncbi:MAG: hypothetical protein PHX87_04880 [Candidatus Peribacteraceae bacterium]|nr:hypothetical protein [Candidatus Peribacteraceae bacterium]MDD5742730.1 hypothetical protein [Candidatus Peribacteraceae bacterium]